MGIKTDIYLKSRSAVDFAIECQRDPALKGLPSRICDAAMVKAWERMRGEPAESGDSLELSDLQKPFDDLSDIKLRLVLELLESLNRRKRENLNLRRAYK